jgi:hypothetical protein
LALLESPHPLVRLANYGKLKKMISKLKEKKLSQIDKRVIRGLFLTKI